MVWCRLMQGMTVVWGFLSQGFVHASSSSCASEKASHRGLRLWLCVLALRSYGALPSHRLWLQHSNSRASRSSMCIGSAQRISQVLRNSGLATGVLRMSVEKCFFFMLYKEHNDYWTCEIVSVLAQKPAKNWGLQKIFDIQYSIAHSAFFLNSIRYSIRKLIFGIRPPLLKTDAQLIFDSKANIQHSHTPT